MANLNTRKYNKIIDPATFFKIRFIKMTDPRVKVMLVLQNAKEPLSARDIFDLLQKLQQPLSQRTIYQVLVTFCKITFIQEVNYCKSSRSAIGGAPTTYYEI